MRISIVDSTLLAFDYGTCKTGVALGRRGHSSPLAIIPTRKGLPDKTSIDTLMRDWRPQACIVGVPAGDADALRDLADKAMRFAHWLQRHYSLPIEWVNESYSSCIIERRAGEQIDDQSAVVLLDQWYNQHTIQAET